LKVGIASDGENKDKLAELLLFKTTTSEGKLRSLAEVKAAIKEGQESLYYISGDTPEAVARSPHLEAYKSKGYEVLYFTEPVDELVTQTLDAYAGTPLKSVSKGACDLKTEAPKNAGDYAALCEHLQRALDAHVKEVRVSERLVSSPVCLVAGEHDLSPHMERILRQAQQNVPTQKRILEINPAHAEIQALNKRLSERRDDDLLKTYAQVLLGQALLAEGSPLPDPAAFADLLSDLVLRSER
jgi:molecular chaperone HtpG